MDLFSAVLKRSNALRDWHPLWRKGQRLFQALHDTNVTLANEIRGTDIDPFYDDTRCMDFYAWLTEQGSPSEPTEKHKVRQGDIKG